MLSSRLSRGLLRRGVGRSSGVSASSSAWAKAELLSRPSRPKAELRPALRASQSGRWPCGGACRCVQSSAALRHGGFEWKDPEGEDHVVRLTYVLRDGTEKHIRGKIGDNAMYLAHRYDIPLEGACEASLACSTCHVYVSDPHFDTLPEPQEEEEDMLDLAVFLKPNSRLGCQIVLGPEHRDMVLTLPQATRNFYVDGHVPEPH